MSESEAPKKKSRIGWVSWLALLAIVGILAAVLIPAFPDYRNRSQASEAVSLMGGAKTPLAEYFADKEQWPKSLGEVAGLTSGKYTRSIAITKGAGGKGEIELTATMKTEGVDRRVAGYTILMTSKDGGRTWVCRPGTMPAKNLPGTCRD